jgi:hypothetical protein
MQRTPILAAIVLSLTPGCGGGSGDSTVVPRDVAEEIGCSSSYKDDTTEEFFVEAVGKCTFENEEIRLLTFANNEARDNFEEIARGFGGRYVKGDGFLVEVGSADAADHVEAELG